LENSTILKEPKQGCKCKDKVTELQDQVSYLVSTLQQHADEIKASNALLGQIRVRMGL